MQLTCDLDAPTKDQYTLKVWGYNEYLAPTTFLCDYEYVHNCIKLEEDVLLILIPDRLVDKSLARTYQDDKCEIKLENILPNEPVLPISYDNLKILLETLEKEMMKLEKAAEQIDKIDSPTSLPCLQPSGVIQSVKLVVNLMGNLETIDITEALEALKDSCNQFLPNAIGEVWNDKAVSDIIKNNCTKIRTSIQGLIEMYCNAFRVDFEWIKRDDSCDSRTAITDIQDSMLVRISAVHRPSPDWKFDDFIVNAQIYHGTRPVGKRVLTHPCTPIPSLYPRILMNTWLDLEDVPINSLARESRLVLTLSGRTLITQDGNDKDAPPQYKSEDIGWAAVQFFNYEGTMVNGSMLLSIWPKEANFIYGPAPSPGTHPDPNHPVFSVIVAGLPNAYFPPVPPQIMDVPKLDFESLDEQTQQMLMDVVEKDMLFKIPSNDREVLWEKRHYLYMIPIALPKILLAAHRWEWACLPDLHGMLRNWKPMKPVEAVQLLLPTFPDVEVRHFAVMWMNGLTSDELVDFLPQLVVALRHETYEDSPLSAFLLRRALQSLRVAHHLFWLLSHNLPGVTPQECKYDFVERDNTYIAEVRHYRRLLLLLRALLAVSGKALSNCFMTQQLLNKTLQDIAENVQKSKESQRMKVLHNGLEILHATLDDNPTSLPLSPTLQVSGVHARGSSYFQSNTLPLKVLFLAKDGSPIPAIYKVGDDLQQDMLVLQMVRLMDKLWLKEGLDLKMVTFGCVPTGKRKGIIELVTKAETLRKIHVEHGLTGSFKDKPIAEWLAKHNPSELEYSRAVENFTASCAGYCVVTYILGICDRHNDNIMLKTSGHLFHIDFGKFLGDAQMFGNFKRDRAPFVLTSDMAYVINGGDRPSEKFHKFVDLCCQAFNIIRNNGNLFLYLFTLMASSGIKGVTAEAVNNLNQGLLPGLSNPEAAANFARLIESSLKSWFTQINFFLHNLAQFKISGEQEGGELLSFVPKRYTMQTDGRLSHVQVLGYRKRYDPDKYYVYVLRVFRHGQAQHMEVLRTYKEFCEFHQKLCIHFPLANLSSLSTGLHVGRSNTNQVTRKRYVEISQFVTSLFQTAQEICHSDLVYTFFHPLLRDQTPAEQYSKKAKDRRADDKSDANKIKGQLKLSIHFQRGVFRVMVHHARGLPLINNSQEPSTYVKVYLQPDPSKTTKRKTKVVRKNCHPSFMETLEYRMALDIIMGRTLKATVWNYDALQENQFLGGLELPLGSFDLNTERTEWYPLSNVSR
ncbi:C2 domain containing protein [Oryctes borbonicus]|uniref:C2 domain containing protein n=1 Tax=Oryctes borbonicus TaxID=1629725 RepID=A0A0T6AY96_9SCAR|nr:C2 domain containing protein [Oryctes borbonicus]